MPTKKIVEAVSREDSKRMDTAEPSETPVGRAQTSQIDVANYKPPRDSHGGFMKGHSGNPNGRPPKGKSFAELARALPDVRKQKLLDRMERKILEEGSAAAFREYRDTAEGRPGVVIVNAMPGLEDSPLLQALLDRRTVEGSSRLLGQSTSTPAE